MTVQQEAFGMINSMPDESVKMVLEFIKNMTVPAPKNEAVDVSKRIGIAKGRKGYTPQSR